MFDLEAHGPDTFVGVGPRYPWGGLYGGQIVAQALHAGALSVEAGYEPHSIRAYFIRPGEHKEPVRYEVDRIRNGRSFVTRRVVARQAIGAILNAECSFQRPEQSAQLQTIAAPAVPSPDGLENTSFSNHFDRLFIPEDQVGPPNSDGAGRVTAWLRATDDLAKTESAAGRGLHECWLAYISDDLATDTVRAALMQANPGWKRDEMMSVSLDHTVWFHRPARTDEWQLHDFSCHHVSGSRGLAVGHVFTQDGEHVATVSQEVLVRDRRAQ